jgi:ribosomal protein S18 acetylase RimI-like enzyme
MLIVEQVDPADAGAFREMAEAFWKELMPHADAIQTPARRDAYFRQAFGWDGEDDHPHWARVDGRRVGFLSFCTDVGQRRARVSNLYVVPEERRKGYGTAMVRWLCGHLDALGVERIDLDVRRDNPDALAFWRAQGYGVAGYRMRQYRDPVRGVAYEGALSSDFV